MTSPDWLMTTAQICLYVLIGSMLLALVRLIKGPSLSDRVVALDLMTVVVVGILGVRTILTGQTVYLFTGMVSALIAFLGTTAFSYYIEKGGKR